MKQEELLRKAKKLYKKGVVFECLKGFGTYQSLGDDFLCISDETPDMIWVNWSGPGINGCVYYNGRWAERLNIPKNINNI